MKIELIGRTAQNWQDFSYIWYQRRQTQKNSSLPTLLIAFEDVCPVSLQNAFFVFRAVFAVLSDVNKLKIP